MGCAGTGEFLTEFTAKILLEKLSFMYTANGKRQILVENFLNRK